MTDAAIAPDVLARLKTEVATIAHPAAEAIVLATDDRLAEMAADIASHGLRSPIVLDEDERIIDGRNRWIACRLAAVAPRFVQYAYAPGTIPDYVRSHNLMRRDMTPGQRAAGAARLATLGRGNPTGTNQHSQGNTSTEGIPPTIPRAAAMAGVSHASVERAREVIRSGEQDVIDKLERGEMPIREAQRVVRERKGLASPKPPAGPKKGEALPEPKHLRVVRTNADELAEQVCSLIARLNDVSRKVTPEALFGDFPNRLRCDLDRYLPDAAAFLSDLHLAWAGDRAGKSAAG